MFYYPTGPLGSISFQSIFSLLFKMGGFYYSLLKFMSSVISTLLLSPFSKLFISVVVNFSSIISIWVFYDFFYFLLRFSIFSFFSREFVIDCRSIFMTAALKSLSDNSNSWLISVLSSVDCFSPFKLWFSGSCFDGWFSSLSWTLCHSC